jgi:membrane peptidoglycan carboxypeptidase
VISQITNQDGEKIETFQPKRIRRVISGDVAETLRSFMYGVVTHGTGKHAQIEGIKVGGKTGTAQKFDMKLKKYIRNRYLASFIGFAPYERPEFVLAIFLDSPRPRYYGGEVAAPIFATIMRHILNYSPEKSETPIDELPVKTASLTVPDVEGLSISSIEELLDSRNLSYSVSGSGEYVMEQSVNKEKVNLVLGDRKLGTSRLPDLRGLTIREALRKIDFSNYRVTVSGYGRVITQSVPPGTRSEGLRALHLTCAE